MHEALVQIAVTKARSPEERALLNGIAKLAAELTALETTFEERINTSKVSRGEKPTKLGQTRKQELDRYDKDADEITSQLAQDLASMEHPAEVIRTVYVGLNSDVTFWKQAHKHTHPADMSIVSEFLQAKTRLRDAMASYLKKMAE
jgi:hypothetical protein